MSETTQAWVAAGVRAAIGAFTQAQDAGRTADVVALYTRDGTLEVPGADPITGHEALRKAYEGWAPTTPQLHLVGNTVVTAVSDTEATATSDAVFLQKDETGWAVRVIGHYTDELRHEDGAWLFHRRTTTYTA